MPRIYVASLSDYNNGCLHGAWIDLDGKDLEEVQEAIAGMLCESKYPNVIETCPDCKGVGRLRDGQNPAGRPCDRCDGHGKWDTAEEYAIHDSEGFPSGFKVEEYHGLSELIEVSELMDEQDEDVLAAALEVADGQKPDDIREALDRYQGTYDSPEAYAENHGRRLRANPQGPARLHPPPHRLGWHRSGPGARWGRFVRDAGRPNLRLQHQLRHQCAA